MANTTDEIPVYDGTIPEKTTERKERSNAVYAFISYHIVIIPLMNLLIFSRELLRIMRLKQKIIMAVTE